MVVDIHIKSGAVLEIMQVNRPDAREGRGERSPKLRVTDEKQIERNLRSSRRWCARLINQNFAGCGVWMGLDYDEGHLPRDYDDAIRQVTNFLRRLRALLKRMGRSSLRYIVVTECLGGRLHHHVIVNAVDYQAVRGLWTQGGLSYQAMDRHTDYICIANYITKERRDDRKFKKKWMQSKNLERPDISVAPARHIGAPKLPRGYKELEREIEAGEFGPCMYIRAIKVDRTKSKDGGKRDEKGRAERKVGKWRGTDAG